MHQYAAVVTSGRRFVSAESTTSAALNRNYLGEVWRGELPKAAAAIFRQLIQVLDNRSGSRRRGTPRSRVLKDMKTT